MKSRESVVRLRKFQVREKSRQVAQIDTMMGEFTRMAADLDAQIAYEEKKTGIDDPGHFAYSTFAKAARARRENLQNSTLDLQTQLKAAEEALAEAEAELLKAERLEERDGRTAEPDPVVEQRSMMIG